VVGESEVVVISGKLGMSPNPRGVSPTHTKLWRAIGTTPQLAQKLVFGKLRSRQIDHRL